MGLKSYTNDGFEMAENKCRACQCEIVEDSPRGLCWSCLYELSDIPSEMALSSGADDYFRQNGTGLACPCCGSQLTTSEISARACSMCGDMVSLEHLLEQVDRLVSSWQESS